MNNMFDCILIANRGEIACRIMRTAKRLGVRTVAIHSDIDADALHVAMADHAVSLGGETAAESYLKGDAIIAAALDSGAQAIHPGYGFLSENAAFARACEQNNIVFIGPPATAMDAMASKSAAKKLMQDADVPVLPGYHGDAQDPKSLISAANDTGFPLMLKASAGGGGKGMRIVQESSEFEAMLDAVKRESLSSFGDDHVLLERYVEQPRHIEIQIFSDTHNNHLHLFERDCSVQRRHQKVLEEAPAPGLDDATRQRMGEAAVNAARAVGYVGAGTVEFIADTDGSFYFMEMNTRLQVEHPVTEMITGVDLVEWQLRVACGEELPCKQNELSASGHAIEARLYAEDPANEFLPSSGQLDVLSFAEAEMQGDVSTLRIETGVRQGDTVSVHYDPMIAKIVALGNSRQEALDKLSSALADTVVVGPTTNLQYLRYLLAQPGFVQGGVTTRFIESLEAANNSTDENLWQNPLTAMALASCVRIQRLQGNSAQLSGWRMNTENTSSSLWLSDDKQYRVTVEVPVASDGTYTASIEPLHENEQHSVWQLEQLRIKPLTTDNNSACRVDAKVSSQTGKQNQPQHLSATIAKSTTDTIIYPLALAQGDDALWPHSLRLQHNALASVRSHSDDSAGSLRAPMPGKVIAINVNVGDKVTEGQTLMVVEAMKMEHAITAPTAGSIAEIGYAVGDSVNERSTLLQMDESST